MTQQSTSASEHGELDVDDFVPEELAPGEEVIDGDVAIDSNGIRRGFRGRLLPGTKSPNPHGRPKGLKYRQFKQSLLVAFHRNGGTDWLAGWGRQNPSQFFRLMARMIPLELQGELKSSGTLQLVLKPTALDDCPPGVERNDNAAVLVDGTTGEVLRAPADQDADEPPLVFSPATRPLAGPR